MSSFTNVLQQSRSGGIVQLARLSVLLIMALIAYMFLATLEEVITAPGDVAPQGDVKVIQHLEGGIIQEVLVHDGSLVKKGTPLMRVTLGLGAANAEQLNARMDGLTLRRARLLAETSDMPPTFPKPAGNRQPDVLAAELRDYEAGQDKLQNSLRVLDEQIRQVEQQRQEYLETRRAKQQQSKLLTDDIRMLQGLIADGLASRLELNKRQSEKAAIDGQIRSLGASLTRSDSARDEARQRKTETIAAFRQAAQAQLTTTENQIAELRQSLVAADAQRQRREIRSPVDGIVTAMRKKTIGGVIAPGEPILEIVPVNDTLVVDSRLNPADRGFVAKDQDVTIKVSAYDFTRYGSLTGKVLNIGADVSVSPGGQVYYPVRISLSRNHLGDAVGQFPVTPGMPVTVEIHTGSRTIISYLMRPVLKLKDEAFKER